MDRQEFYVLMQDFYMLVGEGDPNDLDTFLEAMEELEELKSYLSERIEALRPVNNQDAKYTLKQLHQAWGAGRATAEK